MAASKPEVLRSQLVVGIGTKFQRLNPYSWGLATQCKQPECCPTKPEVGNPRWRPLNRKYLDLSLQMGQERNSKGYTHVFGVQQLNGSSLNAVRHKPEVGNPRWRLYGWISDFRFGQTTFLILPLSCRTPKTQGQPLKFRSYLFYKLRSQGGGIHPQGPMVNRK